MKFLSKTCSLLLKNQIFRHCHVLSIGRTLAYSSDYSLDKLYPQSSLKITTPSFTPQDPNEKFTGYIPMKELQIKYTAASGPGGQNVNRVNTKVDVRFHVRNATWLPDDVKDKLYETEYNKINKEGYLIVKSDLTRSQQLNVADALRKIRQMIRNLIVVPPEPRPLTVEKERQRQMRASQERVFVKRLKTQIKSDRRDICKEEI